MFDEFDRFFPTFNTNRNRKRLTKIWNRSSWRKAKKKSSLEVFRWFISKFFLPSKISPWIVNESSLAFWKSSSTVTENERFFIAMAKATKPHLNFEEKKKRFFEFENDDSFLLLRPVLSNRFDRIINDQFVLMLRKFRSEQTNKFDCSRRRRGRKISTPVPRSCHFDWPRIHRSFSEKTQHRFILFDFWRENFFLLAKRKRRKKSETFELKNPIDREIHFISHFSIDSITNLNLRKDRRHSSHKSLE